MIPKITSFMRENGARYFTQMNGTFNGVPINTKVFVDKKGDMLATLQSIKEVKPNGQITTNSILSTVSGLTKYTLHIIDMVKLKKFKGKENVKFPYRINSSVVYDSNKSRESFFFIKDGVSFLKTEKDGLMLYKASAKKFKTDRVTLTRGTSE